MDPTQIETELADFEAAEAARLGLATRGKQWTDKMLDPVFTRSQREHTTLLIGGLTLAHDALIEEALGGLGYQVRALPCPDEDALRFGKEFGNRGQCNPTWFTVGNLVKELSRLRDEEGMSSQEIIDGYIFLTAGACGPCRFGMYVTEYRKALRDAGFDGFRVVLFQQTGGLAQATGDEAGLELGPPFFLALLKSLFAGDVLNAQGYRIRPYELTEGETDAAMAEAKRVVGEALREGKSVLRALRRARALFAKIPIDPLRPKPKVSIIGEFWAMTTEGDGNYQLQKFLQEEGAECDVQLVTAWLLYMLWEVENDTESRAELRETDGGMYGLEDADVGLKLASVFLGEQLTRGVFETFARAVGLEGYHLSDMKELANVAHQFYDRDLRGGEGHMEVAKLLLNVERKKSHMTLSVKPFGCMPSSGVSDGVQSLITEIKPDAIYCPVETSGDGAVNFYSRVQMFLFKARQRALGELERVMEEQGVSEAELRDFLKKNPAYAKALHHSPHVHASRAADLVEEIGPLVRAESFGARLQIKLQRQGAATTSLFTSDLPAAASLGKALASHLPSLLRGSAEAGSSTIGRVVRTWMGIARDALVSADAAAAESAVPNAEAAIPNAEAVTLGRAAQG